MPGNALALAYTVLAESATRAQRPVWSRTGPRCSVPMLPRRLCHSLGRLRVPLHARCLNAQHSMLRSGGCAVSAEFKCCTVVLHVSPCQHSTSHKAALLSHYAALLDFDRAYQSIYRVWSTGTAHIRGDGAHRSVQGRSRISGTAGLGHAQAAGICISTVQHRPRMSGRQSLACSAQAS